MTLLVIASWGCFLGLAVFLIGLWWFDRRQRKLREHRRVEISELAMIFQTLRDVVSEQKMLAKDFNENLEEKIGVVKKMVSDARCKLAEIEESITKCSKRVQDVEEELEVINSKMGKLMELLNMIESRVYKNITESENVLLEIRERIRTAKGNQGVDNTEEDSSRSNAEQIVEEKGVEKEDKTKVSDEEALHISEELDLLKTAYSDILGFEKKDNEEELRKFDLTPVQKIVLEYHKSGMTTSEIAKELGITKGEVRLILSVALAKVEKYSNEG